MQDFKRIFTCPSWEPTNFTESTVKKFTNEQMTDEPAPVKRGGDQEDKIKRAAEAAVRQNSNDIPAGYTYFGQFVDHDLTRDETPLGEASRISHGDLINKRTPTLDLDSVYNGSVIDHLFEVDEPANLKIPNAKDLPRKLVGGQRTLATIGDDRNDENSIVSQVHLAFMLAHNELMERQANMGELDKAAAFTRSRRVLTWLYHWVIRHDFLPRIIRKDILDAAFDPGAVNKFGDVDFSIASSQIPGEFAIAAYRFGHTMVRDSYQTNNEDPGFGNFTKIFVSGSEDDLQGNRALTDKRVIQWDWFLQMKSSAPGLFPQKAKPLDTKLSHALTQLERDPDDENINNFLAARNILRGVRTGLPHAECVVKAINSFLSAQPNGNLPMATYPAGGDASQSKMMPALWYFILAEAEDETEAQNDGTLGVVGSTIVAFTFAELFRNTGNSYFNRQPTWTPDDEIESGLLENDDKIDGKTHSPDNHWTLASIIRLSGLPVTT